MFASSSDPSGNRSHLITATLIPWEKEVENDPNVANILTVEKCREKIELAHAKESAEQQRKRGVNEKRKAVVSEFCQPHLGMELFKRGAFPSADTISKVLSGIYKVAQNEEFGSIITNECQVPKFSFTEDTLEDFDPKGFGDLGLSVQSMLTIVVEMIWKIREDRQYDALFSHGSKQLTRDDKVGLLLCLAILQHQRKSRHMLREDRCDSFMLALQRATISVHKDHHHKSMTKEQRDALLDQIYWLNCKIVYDEPRATCKCCGNAFRIPKGQHQHVKKDDIASGAVCNQFRCECNKVHKGKRPTCPNEESGCTCASNTLQQNHGPHAKGQHEDDHASKNLPKAYLIMNLQRGTTRRMFGDNLKRNLKIPWTNWVRSFDFVGNPEHFQKVGVGSKYQTDDDQRGYNQRKPKPRPSIPSRPKGSEDNEASVNDFSSEDTGAGSKAIQSKPVPNPLGNSQDSGVSRSSQPLGRTRERVAKGFTRISNQLLAGYDERSGGINHGFRKLNAALRRIDDHKRATIDFIARKMTDNFTKYHGVGNFVFSKMFRKGWGSKGSVNQVFEYIHAKGMLLQVLEPYSSASSPCCHGEFLSKPKKGHWHSRRCLRCARIWQRDMAAVINLHTIGVAQITHTEIPRRFHWSSHKDTSPHWAKESHDYFYDHTKTQPHYLFKYAVGLNSTVLINR